MRPQRCCAIVSNYHRLYRHVTSPFIRFLAISIVFSGLGMAVGCSSMRPPDSVTASLAKGTNYYSGAPVTSPLVSSAPVTSPLVPGDSAPSTDPNSSPPSAAPSPSGAPASSNSTVYSSMYTITHQPPANFVPYASNPESLVSKPLPNGGKGGPLNHLYAGFDGATGDEIARCVLNDCGATSGEGFFQAQERGSSDRGVPLYYTGASDPSARWYKLNGCRESLGVNGKAFLAPNAAEFSNSSDDNDLTIWDQTDSLLVSFYHYGGAASLPSCSCTYSDGPGCACTYTPPGGPPSYCSIEDPQRDPDWGLANSGTANHTGGSLVPGAGFSAFAGVVRHAELQSCQINHAIRIVDDCHNPNNPVVFPNTDSGDPGLLCGAGGSGPNSSRRPPGGALLFLDYTDAQISAMNLSCWQHAYIYGLSHYGAYVSVTGGAGIGMEFGENNLEDNSAWSYRNLQDPWWTWIGSQPGISYSGTGRYSGYVFQNIPLVNGTDVSQHLHMADPCVAKAMAGQPGGCS